MTMGIRELNVCNNTIFLKCVRKYHIIGLDEAGLLMRSELMMKTNILWYLSYFLWKRICGTIFVSVHLYASI